MNKYNDMVQAIQTFSAAYAAVNKPVSIYSLASLFSAAYAAVNSM